MTARVCYVCLDPVEEDVVALCACKMVAHEACLKTMMVKMGTQTCTICKAPFVHTFDLEAAHPVQPPAPPPPRRCACPSREDMCIPPGICAAMFIMLGLLFFVLMISSEPDLVSSSSLVLVACGAFTTSVLCICTDILCMCNHCRRNAYVRVWHGT